MKKALKLVALLGCVLAIGFGAGAAKAATIAEQITSAIAKGDFKTVQQLTSGNPAKTGFTTSGLLSYVRSNLTSKPDDAVGAMTLASALGDGIKAEDAKDIAGKLKGIVDEITDKALLLCNPEGDDQQKKTDASLSPEKQALAKSMEALMMGAENLAGLPVIAAVDPGLLDQIKTMNAQCQGGDTQLAQRPSFSPQRQPPIIIPPPYPPRRDEPSAQ